MATYAAASDAQALIPKFVITASTVPSTTDLTSFLEKVDAEINACLAGKGLTVPFSSDGTDVQDKFAELLESANAHGAAVKVLGAAFPAGTGPFAVVRTELHETFLRIMAGLKDGSLVPPGIAATATLVGPTTYTTNFPNETDEPDFGDQEKPLFRVRDHERW